MEQKYQILRGDYKAKWFIAGEAVFDHAIVPHFKPTSSFKEFVYNQISNRWFKPRIGGNFQFGLESGYSLKKYDITFKIGKTITQDFRASPLIPYYLQLDYYLKINDR